MRWAPDHPVFAGHFPGDPLVPGVLVLQWVIDELCAEHALQPQRIAVPRVKFLQPVRPDMEVLVHFEGGEQSHWQFTVKATEAQVPVAQGVVRLDV